MSISILIGALAPLLLAPWLTHLMFQAVYDLEQAQIAVDNAAIVVGQADRELVRWIANSNRYLKALEAAHHPLHLCAHSVVGTPFCAQQDKAMEGAIAFAHQSAFQMASVRWLRNLPAGRREAARLGVTLDRCRRHNQLPVREVRCPICSLGVAWEPRTDLWVSHLGQREPRLGTAVDIVGGGLLVSSGWDYALHPWD